VSDGFKTFTVFRTGDLSETHDQNQAPISPDVQSFWGVVFPDGTCTLRWAGVVAATSVWASFEDAMKVHGHFEPRYGTRLEWTTEAQLAALRDERDRAVRVLKVLLSAFRLLAADDPDGIEADCLFYKESFGADFDYLRQLIESEEG